MAPRVKATHTTAYEILNQVVEIAETEPSRIRMNQWFIHGARRLRAMLSLKKGTKYPCNSVGCVAGWTCALVMPKETIHMQDEWGIGSRAAGILGLNEEQRALLFLPDNMKNWPRPGTKAHAKRFIEHVRHYQELWKDQLMSKVVDLR